MKSSRFFCLTVCALLAGGGGVFASSSSLTVEMKAAYQSGFYPGVVQSADALIAENPSAAISQTALLYKGESLYRMGQSSEAARALLSITSDSPDIYAGRCYWLGRVYQDAHRDEDALILFYQTLKEGEGKSDFYDYALFYAGISQFNLKRYSQASSLFDYVLANGSKYTLADYEKAAVFQMIALNEGGEFARSKKVGDSLLSEGEKENSPLRPQTLHTILLYRGDAYEGLKSYRAAYDDYCTVITTADASLAATAMARAYAVSSEHKDQVQEEPGAVLEKAQDRLATYPELVSNFWTRLAIDAYNQKDYKKALSYFDEAQKGADENLLQTAALYRGEIAFQQNLSSGCEKAAESALSLLDHAEKEYHVTSTSELYPSFAVSRARYEGLCSNWKESLKASDAALSSADESVKETARYWKALSLYQTGDYEKAAATLEKASPSDAPARNLLARALAKGGKIRSADAEFYALSEKSLLDENGNLDYAKSLMNGGFMISAGNQASKATGAEADYIAALSLFNRRLWEDAAASFEKALRAFGKNALSQEHRPYALFYAGYSHYRLGNFDQAWNHLSSFTSENFAHSLRFMALTTAVRSSVQAGNYQRAFPVAEQAIRAAMSEEQTQEAVLLCAGVYADAENYDAALKTLAPYQNGKNDFAYQCRYKTAQIYALKKDYASADKTYLSLSREKNAGALAEDAAYRRGELAYTSEKYAESIPLYEDYLKKWPQGQFADAALFFEASALAKTGSIPRAILYFQQVDDLNRESTYKYSAEKNLVDLFRSEKNYGQALAYARKMMLNYGDQSKNDSIPQAIRELEALNAGADEKIVKKEQEYETAGKEKTPAGRKAGTELAALYASSPSDFEKARSLAQTLLPLQEKNLPEEAASACENAAFLAKSLRSEGSNQKAAEMYLKAAQYARSGGKEETAQRSLYGAVEAFDAAGKLGDAKASYESLKELYPKSRFLQSAAQIVNQGN